MRPMSRLVKKAAIALLCIMLVAMAPVRAGGATRTVIQDGKDDFTTVIGTHWKQPFLDIRNVTVDYDEPSDRVLVTIGFYARLPSEGPAETSGTSSDYYYSCSFKTGENATLDRATVILERGMNWSSAYLQTYIRGNIYEGSASPVKYRVDADSITFTIPARIPAWGERPKRLLIVAEAGYESLSSSGSVDAAHFDRAPETNEGLGLIAFEVPPTPLNVTPILVLLAVLVPSTVAARRLLRGHGNQPRKRRR